MTRTHSLFGAALTVALIGGGLSAASAQTFTVSGSASSGTYSYLVTPSSMTINDFSLNFSDPNVTAGAAPAGFTNITSPVFANTGIFEFYSVAGTAAPVTFTFTSPDGTGGTVGANAFQSGGSQGFTVNGIGPAPSSAPEPSQGAALGLGLLGLAGLALSARRRSTLA